MKNILIVGAGLSSTALIQYLLSVAEEKNYFITVADIEPAKAEAKINNNPRGRGVWLDATKTNDRKDIISRMDLVITMVPAHLHLEIAHDCIKLNRPCITSSYITHELYRMGDEARDRELSFINEMVLDPGMDHMAVKRAIDTIQRKGGKIKAVRSYGGGLLSSESAKGNSWQFKFTWNPRNLVLTGQGTAQYIENAKLKYIPYLRLFRDPHMVAIDGLGEMEVVVDRDALLCQERYGLADVPDIFRGILRYPGFSKAWYAMVKIGLTDGSFPILNSGDITYSEWMEGYLPPAYGTGSIKDRIAQMLDEDPKSTVMNQLKELGLFKKKKIGLDNATPALILEQLLRQQWMLEEGDIDQVVLQHEIDYELDGVTWQHRGTLLLQGEDHINTAMAKIVGLPPALCAVQLLEERFSTDDNKAVLTPAVYNPLLDELAEMGMSFSSVDVRR